MTTWRRGDLGGGPRPRPRRPERPKRGFSAFKDSSRVAKNRPGRPKRRFTCAAGAHRRHPCFRPGLASHALQWLAFRLLGGLSIFGLFWFLSGLRHQLSLRNSIVKAQHFCGVMLSGRVCKGNRIKIGVLIALVIRFLNCIVNLQ